eukprot:1259570-Prymnesium_polylepis.1
MGSSLPGFAAMGTWSGLTVGVSCAEWSPTPAEWPHPIGRHSPETEPFRFGSHCRRAGTTRGTGSSGGAGHRSWQPRMLAMAAAIPHLLALGVFFRGGESEDGGRSLPFCASLKRF